MKEKRKAKRISLDVKLISRNSGNCVDSQMINMSTEGAFVATSHLLAVDDEFVLHMQLPGDVEIMIINARIAWTKDMSGASPAGMGIQFTNMLPEHKKKLDAFIEKNPDAQSSQGQLKVYI